MRFASRISASTSFVTTIVRTSTTLPAGIPELWAAVEAHERFRADSPAHAAELRRRIEEEIVGRVRDILSREVAERLETDPSLRKLVDRVVARELDPRSAADRLLAPTRR